ncbi:transglutaminase domain-containing protein [Actinomadura craniellae]|uniref:Transglutaminase domain-containing protein n=1 Tax=Actinomadura craniellae TaxID=2231787 RepID=A0A365H4R4_9ACTN|nr:transglutaminase domain-containing protein [Actinomadura craniellae]RAY14039.1 transglutaminase domain-containing protein [Actinomadura craniellae]
MTARPALLLAAATTAPALAFAPGYTDPAVLLALLGVTATTAVAATKALVRRLPPTAALLAGLPLVLAAVVALAGWRPGQAPAAPGTLAAAIDALVHSGARVLTTTPPVPTTVDTLTLPLAGTWLAGAAATLALHAHRPLLALLPPVLLLAGALVLAGPDAPPAYSAVAVLVAAGTALLGDTGPRTLATAAALAGAALLGGTLVPADWPVRPADPRAAATPPSARQEALNPLGYLPAWTARPDQPLLDARTTRPVDLRWVTLTDFTGLTWLPESAYLPAGDTLPPADPTPARTTPHQATLTIRQLPGPWLPTPGHPRHITGLPIAHDTTSGTLVARDGHATGHRYTITADVPLWSTADTARALVPTDPTFDRYRELPPGAPARIREIAAIVAGTTSPYQQAARLADHLRTGYDLDVRARGGHGYANLAAFLVMPGEGRRGAGTADQFASAFAVLARAAGLPSRITVGFRPGHPDSAGTRHIRTGDATAWGEIYFDRVGWVPFDVTPGGRTTGSLAAPQGPEAAPAPARTAPRPAAATPTPTPAQPPGQDPDGASRSRSPLPAAVALLVLSPAAIPLLRHRRTRRRLHRGTAQERALGLWAELMDGLRLAGRQPPAGRTASDIISDITRAEDRTQPAHLERLAAHVTAAAFGPPATARPLDPQEIDAAIIAVHTHLRALRRTRPWPQRALWWLDPRPLFW